MGEDRLVSVEDGRVLRAMVRGEATTLVMFEAGLGASGLYWDPVHRDIGTRAVAVAYERAGYGASDPGPRPRTIERLASDLDAVIDAFTHRHLVLVGHSWGGPIVRRVAQIRTDRGKPPAGLVLVDQSDENSSLYFRVGNRIGDRLQSVLLPLMARTGLLKVAVRTLLKDLPSPVREQAVLASTSVPSAQASADEILHVTAGLRALRANRIQLGDVPIRVLSGQKTTMLDLTARRSLTSAHEVTAGEFPNANLVPAHHSGHMIHLSEPALVAATIHEILDSIDRSAD